jgi:hypothetical protein
LRFLAGLFLIFLGGVMLWHGVGAFQKFGGPAQSATLRFTSIRSMPVSRIKTQSFALREPAELSGVITAQTATPQIPGG